MANNGKANKAPRQDWLLALQEFSSHMAAIQRAEKERRASLTPAQREAEDARRAANAVAAAKAKLSAKIEKATRGYAEHASFTLMEFGCFLSMKNPEEFSDWLFDYSGENDRILKLVQVLHTCVRLTPAHREDVPLYPLNPAAPSKEWRFSKADLMRVALERRLGRAESLVSVFGTPSPPVIRTAPASSSHASVAVVRRAPKATRSVAPKPPIRTPPLVPKRLPWHEQIDALATLIRRQLERRAASAGQPFDKVLGELGEKSSSRAVYSVWVRKYVPKEKAPPVGWNHFRGYVNKAHGWLKFKPGDRGEGKPDEAFLLELLGDEETP